MREKKDRIRQIQYDLSRCNKDAQRFLQVRGGWARGYYQLQRTELWAYGKKLLLELALLTQDWIVCPVCNRPLTKSRVTLHHRVYDMERVFDPRYTQFLHKFCHREHHRLNPIHEANLKVKKMKNYHSSRGYAPVAGKFQAYYIFIFAFILILFILLSWMVFNVF